MTAVGAVSSLYQQMSIGDRDSSFASPVDKETAAISAKQQLTILRYHQQSIDTSPTVNRKLIGRVSTDVPTDSVDRQSANSRNMSSDTWSSLSQSDRALNMETLL